ncbi:MAG: hypothetical protein RL215_192 [Planctomycetota bacterium]
MVRDMLLRRRSQVLLGGIVCLVVVLLTWRLVLSGTEQGVPDGVSQESWRLAEEATRRRLSRAPERAEVCLTLARQAIEDRRPEVARSCFAQVPISDTGHGLQALFELSQLEFADHQSERAELGFEELLRAAQAGRPVPSRQQLIALRTLSLLYGVQMRTSARARVLQQLMQSRTADVHEAKYYFFPSLLVWQNDWGASLVKQFLEKNPDSRALRNAAARYATGRGELERARAELEMLHQQNPSDLETVAFLMECCHEQDDAVRLGTLAESLPVDTSDEPLLLSEQRGAWLVRRKDLASAVVCFERLQARDPANPAACQGLLACLDGEGRSEDRERLARRAAVLAKLRVSLGPATPENPGAIREVAGYCRELGMTEAAEAFDYFAAAATR